MPRFSAKIDLLKVNKDELSSDVRKEIVNSIRRAARRFLIAAIVKVPIKTGMARGTFLNLGRALNVSVAISPVDHRRLIHRQAGYPAVEKRPESGTIFATVTVPSSESSPLIFNVEVTLNYFNIEEFVGLRSKSAPWRSFEEGQRAFLEEIKTIQLPNFESYLIKTTVSIDAGAKSISPEKRVRIRRQITIR